MGRNERARERERESGPPDDASRGGFSLSACVGIARTTPKRALSNHRVFSKAEVSVYKYWEITRIIVLIQCSLGGLFEAEPFDKLYARLIFGI